mmetsp:Transcript_35869/g.55038  ORF Transcript_35869/g.55038 Transcript_35869/m.55038 type:complete len:148 (+) Transcript_35869:671-1114(+)
MLVKSEVLQLLKDEQEKVEDPKDPSKTKLLKSLTNRATEFITNPPDERDTLRIASKNKEKSLMNTTTFDEEEVGMKKKKEEEVAQKQKAIQQQRKKERVEKLRGIDNEERLNPQVQEDIQEIQKATETVHKTRKVLEDDVLSQRSSI